MITVPTVRRRNSPLLYCASQFKNDINYISDIPKELQKYRIEIRSGRYIYLDNRKIELLVCLYFLRIHLSWEEFLESTFVRYMCGHSSPSGVSPTLLMGRKNCISDALSTILHGSNYISWSPSETISRSQRFLNMGEPYLSAISTARYELKNLYTIRNRIAHRSEYAQLNFRDMVRSEIGYNPRGMTPGRFLMMKKSTTGRRKITYLEYYLNILHTLCDLIVP